MLRGYCMHTDVAGKLCGRATTTFHPKLGMPVCEEHRACLRPPPMISLPPVEAPPTRPGYLVVDVWSDRADLWAANSLLTLCAMVDGRIEVCKGAPGPVLLMLLTAPDLTDAELRERWEEVRVEASGGARNSP